MIFDQLLAKLSYATIPLFWPLWLAVVLALIYIAMLTQSNWRSRKPLIWPRLDAAVVSIFLVPYGLFMLWGVAFAYHDNDFFLETAAGRSLPPMIWPNVGRFFPLQMQEFNFLRHISTTALFYQLIVLAQLGLFCWLILISLAQIARAWRIIAVVMLLCSNSIGIVFADPIYPERNIVFALAVFVVAAQRVDEKPSRLNFIFGTVAAQLAIYYKEPMFLFFATFAFARLLLDWLRARPAGWSWLRDRPFELSLLGVCLIFGVQLLLVLLRTRHSLYVNDTTIGSLTALSRYARTDIWMLALVVGLAFRLRRIRATGDIDPIWDPLVLSAIVYAIILVALGLFADRYAPPIDFVAALYLAREMAHWWAARPQHRWLLTAATAVTATVVLSFGAFRLIEHKSVVRGTVELATFLDRFAAERPALVNVYFPDAHEWQIMNFAGYLRYRYPAAYDRIRLRGPHTFTENRCVYWREYRCEHAVGPTPGDLIARLPDDLQRKTGPQRRLLFEYEWLSGGIPHAVGKLLYPTAPLYVGDDMPVGWLKAGVELQE